ncbi:MAG: pilus assembly protein TadG-related protein [Pseudomonadota bacterium]
MVRVLREFVEAKCGNFAVAVALSIVPIAVAGGGAVDYSRAIANRVTLQKIADAAALAGASIQNPSASEAMAQRHFDAALTHHPDLVGATAAISVEGNRVSVAANASTDMLLASLAGVSDLSVSVEAIAERANGLAAPFELVIALDATNSMAWAGAREKAAEELGSMLSAVYGGASSHPDHYITFIPYTDRINVGVDKAAWAASAPSAGWTGCLQPRHEPQAGFPFAMGDTPPGDLPFDAMPDGFAQPEFGTVGCRDPIVGPTTSRTEVQTALDTYATGSTGRQDLAVAWAWRLLSPRWQGEWGPAHYPADYGDRRKFFAFVTDGRSSLFCEEVNPNYPSPPDGYASVPSCIGSNEITHDGFANIQHMCEQMKADGIEIHVLYVNGVAHGEPYMQACASEGAYYSANSLDEITQSIGSLSTAIGAEVARLVR